MGHRVTPNACVAVARVFWLRGVGNDPCLPAGPGSQPKDRHDVWCTQVSILGRVCLRIQSGLGICVRATTDQPVDMVRILIYSVTRRPTHSKLGGRGDLRSGCLGRPPRSRLAVIKRPSIVTLSRSVAACGSMNEKPSASSPRPSKAATD